jgi:hypothetical protein
MDIMKYKYPPDVSFSEDSNYVILRKTMSDIGFDYDALPIRFVVKAADFGGNCIGVVIPTDYRVIVVPNMPISVYMHELGHGLQGRAILTDATGRDLDIDGYLNYLGLGFFLRSHRNKHL